MSDKPISDLRRRMIADMTIRTFSDKTRHDYIPHVEAFADFFACAYIAPLPRGRAVCGQRYTPTGMSSRLAR